VNNSLPRTTPAAPDFSINLGDLLNATDGSLHRKTKIIATLGPASREPAMIAALITAGVNVFRLNFSHGSHEEHLETYKRIRAASEELDQPVAVLQDLCGPKIRITTIEENFTSIEDGAELVLRLSTHEQQSDSSTVYVNLVDPTKVLSVGNTVLFADGIIELTTTEVHADHVRCRIIKGGRLRSRVGIAFPDSSIDLPATTDKDIKDYLWGIEHGVDYVAISFVQTAEDVQKVKNIGKEKGAHSHIIAKIETQTSLRNIDSILEHADGIMVARGDLGVEVPLSKLPLIQKELIARANYVGKPVIVATQMLHSMVTSIRPTRAETVDCAFAVMSGADAVMLSEETAIGNNPIEAVGYLNRIARQAERSFQFEEYRLRLRDADRDTVPDAIAYAASAASLKIGASAIVARTQTGSTARLVAKYRPQQPLYACTSDDTAARRMCLFWGVRPILCKISSSRDDEIDTALEKVQEIESLPNGSLAVTLGGRSAHIVGSTSVLDVRVMNYLK
jgi:pyruvate kinase